MSLFTVYVLGAFSGPCKRDKALPHGGCEQMGDISWGVNRNGLPGSVRPQPPVLLPSGVNFQKLCPQGALDDLGPQMMPMASRTPGPTACGCAGHLPQDPKGGQ